MIKIFSFVASCAGKKSKTLRYSNSIADTFSKKVEALGGEISYEVMTGDGLKINFCRSCNSCFSKGKCPLAGTDDIETLKEKFRSADIIFFGTPVYFGDISGVARCLFDRISYWAHQFELAGKIVAVFSTASNNHGQEVADRLKVFFDYMGAVVASSSYVYTTAGSPNIFIESEFNAALDEISENLLNTIKDPVSKITDNQQVYWYFRTIITRQEMKIQKITGVKPAAEILVCHERGMENYRTFDKYFMTQFKIQL